MGLVTLLLCTFCMDAKMIDPYAFLDRFAYEVHRLKNLALSMILLPVKDCAVSECCKS